MLPSVSEDKEVSPVRSLPSTAVWVGVVGRKQSSTVLSSCQTESLPVSCFCNFTVFFLNLNTLTVTAQVIHKLSGVEGWSGNKKKIKEKSGKNKQKQLSTLGLVHALRTETQLQAHWWGTTVFVQFYDVQMKENILELRSRIDLVLKEEEGRGKGREEKLKSGEMLRSEESWLMVKESDRTGLNGPN